MESNAVVYLCIKCGTIYSNPIGDCGCTCDPLCIVDNDINGQKYKYNKEAELCRSDCNIGTSKNNLDSTIIEIDQGLEYIIADMWKCGLVTRWACFGHIPNLAFISNSYFIVEFDKVFMELLLREMAKHHKAQTHITCEVGTLYGAIDSPLILNIRNNILLDMDDMYHPLMFWEFIDSVVDLYKEYKSSLEKIMIK